MKDIPSDYNDDDLRQERSHCRPLCVGRTSQNLGIALFVIVVLMLLGNFLATHWSHKQADNNQRDSVQLAIQQGTRR